jgi:hypothetical protein
VDDHQRFRSNPGGSNGTKRMSRREVVGRVAALVGATTALSLPPTGFANTSQGTPVSGTNRAGLVHKGINYDIGTAWEPGHVSRQAWADGARATAAMRREIGLIRDELHCTSISIFGSDVDRLVAGAAMALEHGLHVWLQPRLPGAPADAALDQLAAVARDAERLRQHAPDVTLNVGCELSVFTAGIIPGDSFEERATSLLQALEAGDRLRLYNRRLNAHLRRAVPLARGEFDGDVTYGSGPWEWGEVDWSLFDLVGLDHYRGAWNETTYADVLRAFRRSDKRVVVTEFGCCCYEGAEDAGAAGHDIVDWTTAVPRLKGDYVRSERVQAETIADLLAIHEAEGVHGSFVFTFSEDDYPHSPDPRYDLDMASFGIVKVLPPGGYPPPSGEEYAPPGPDDWEPKLAFADLARLYGSS